MAAAFFRGTGIDQNVKFKDKDKQLIKETEWPAEFDQRVDLSKVSQISNASDKRVIVKPSENILLNREPTDTDIVDKARNKTLRQTLQPRAVPYFPKTLTFAWLVFNFDLGSSRCD